MNKGKWLSFILLVCLLTGFLVGCVPQNAAQPTNAPAPAATAAPAATTAPAATAATEKKARTVTDLTGRKVEIPVEVNRIVDLMGACGIPSVLSALGSADKLVSGICFPLKPEELQYKIQPSYAKIDVISPGESGVDPEQLLALKADVVFSWTDVKNVDQLAQAGIPLLVEDISTYENLKADIKLVGEVVNKQERATEFVAAIDDMAKRIEDKVSAIPEDKKKKVVILWKTKPLSLMGGGSHNTYMTEMTGGVPLTKDIPQWFADIDMEQLMKMDPDIIIVSAVWPESYDEVYQSSEWKSLGAVKEKNVYLAPKGILFWDKLGVEAPLGLLWETYIQYPDLVSYDDVVTESKLFYQKFFNYDLTDDDLKLLLSNKSIHEKDKKSE